MRWLCLCSLFSPLSVRRSPAELPTPISACVGLCSYANLPCFVNLACSLYNGMHCIKFLDHSQATHIRCRHCFRLWMNERFIYIALYCILLYTQSALQSCVCVCVGGGVLSWTITSVKHSLGWCDSCHRTTAPVRSPHTSYRWRGESHRANQVYALTTHQLQVERRESHRDNQVYALTTHQLQVERRESHRANQVYALTTHQLQVERRESHRANQVYALTTHQLQVERRESHRANQVYVLTTHQLQVERRES